MTSPLGQVGRVREGRVDTGTPIFNNVANTGAGFLLGALAASGLNLSADPHWFEQKKAGKATKYVVVLSFSRSEPIKLEPKIFGALTELSHTSWFHHLWLNPNGVVTANFVGIQQGEPKQNLAVEDGELTLVTTDGARVNSAGVKLEEIKTLLVKFFFTNPNRVPPGIPKIGRASDAEMDRRHAAAVEG